MKGATNWLKRHMGTLAIIELVIIIGLATSTVLLAISKGHTASSARLSSQQSSTSTKQAVSTTTYKLSACKPGATQTVGNADYVVGTDIAPGSYRVDSQTNNNGDTNIVIYSSETQYEQSSNPKSSQYGAADQSFMADYGKPTTTKLSDGQYMDVSDDPALFTCQ